VTQTAERTSDVPKSDLADSHQPRLTGDRIALGLAMLALVAATVGALGPARHVRTIFRWPPATLPATKPTEAWYTPLLLAAHRPEAIQAIVPCRSPSALRRNDGRVNLLSTARSPERYDGLFISAEGRYLSVGIGNDVLKRIRLGAKSDPNCSVVVHLQDHSWRVERTPSGATYRGTIDAMPQVSGLFSGVDLRAQPRPSISVTTTPHDTTTVGRQSVAWVLATFAVLAALILVASLSAHRFWPAIRNSVRGAGANAKLADILVVGVLLSWWILAPIGFDDGWVQAREAMYTSSGGFSLYYNTLGANLPLDYWPEWVHHWIVQETSGLVFLRIAALVCLLTSWLVCRWTSGLITRPTGCGEASPWPLACAFLVCAVAWGMTLRPEPVIALLAVGVTGCVASFLDRPRPAPLAVAAVLVPLALAGHHTGVIALAPLVVAAPTALRWGRANVAKALALVFAGSALLVTLLFVGSDLLQRRLDVTMSSAYSDTWRLDDEFSRYALLNVEPAGTPIRRLSVGLMLLAVAAFLLRERRPRLRLDFPSQVLCVSLVLFFVTPSKWAWHFGALVGIAALAISSESIRLRRESQRAATLRPWPFLALGAAVSMGLWSWAQSTAWNPFDLRMLKWYDGVAHALGVLVALVPVAITLTLFILATLRGRPGSFPRIPWRVSSWIAPLLAVPALAFTIGLLVIDTARTDSWTLGRQNISALRGEPDCGLASDVRVPVLSDGQRPRHLDHISAPLPSWVPSPPLNGLPRFALTPTVSADRRSTPWFRVPSDKPLGVFVAGRPGGLDHLAVQWGKDLNGRRLIVATNEFTSGLRRDSGTTAWRFAVAGELGARPSGATLVSFSAKPDLLPGSAIAVTAPIAYRTQALRDAMRQGNGTTLVHPQLLPYMPCARLPKLHAGVVEPPSVLIYPQETQRGNSIPRSLVVEDVSSPFAGVRDVFELQRLPVEDTPIPPSGMIVLTTRPPPGMALAGVDQSTTSS
jgi:hypothetical protein